MQTATIDLIAIATRLKMPPAIYEALKTILNANQSTQYHYEEAIKHLERVKTDISVGNLALPLSVNENTAFISGVKANLTAITQELVNTGNGEQKTNLFLSAYFAMLSILNLFSAEQNHTPDIYLLSDAIGHLNNVLFWQSALTEKGGVK